MSQAACGLAAGHFLDLNLSFAKVFFQTLEGMAELLDTVLFFAYGGRFHFGPADCSPIVGEIGRFFAEKSKALPFWSGYQDALAKRGSMDSIGSAAVEGRFHCMALIH